MGNSGTGAIWHIAALNFEKEFDVKFKHVPYPKGSADIAAALAGKHIDATLADPSVFKSQIDAGTLKAERHAEGKDGRTAQGSRKGLQQQRI